MLPHYLIYVLVDAKLNEDFCAGALILTFSHICLLISVAELDAFTVSNMHESMSNTLCFKAQAQIAALSNGCCHKWLINTFSCASLRVYWQSSAETLPFPLLLCAYFTDTNCLFFYATGAISAGRRDDSSVPPECWQMSPPAFLPLAIKTSCFVSHPEQSLLDLIVLFFEITRASRQTLISKCNPELNLKPLLGGSLQPQVDWEKKLEIQQNYSWKCCKCQFRW